MPELTCMCAPAPHGPLLGSVVRSPVPGAPQRGAASRKTREMRRAWMHSVLARPAMSARERAVLVAEALQAVGWQVSPDAVRQTANTHDPHSRLAKSVMAFVERGRGAKGGKPLVISASLVSSCVCAICRPDPVLCLQEPEDTLPPADDDDMNTETETCGDDNPSKSVETRLRNLETQLRGLCPAVAPSTCNVHHTLLTPPATDRD
jgi:hypothetical protein